MKSGSKRRNTARTCSAAVRYASNRGLTKTRSGQSFLPMKPGIALRTPNLRAS